MERITVNMSPTAMLETCHASQFDVGVQKRFDLVDGSSAYTLTGAETITLKIRTPDGTLVESNVPNTSDSYVIWTSGEGELDAFGICLCSIHVTNGSDELGSGNFIMEVEADPYDGAGVHVVTVGPADICTFETTLPEPLQSVTVDIEATGGNGTPDSPIPINGYTEANITRCGVNLMEEVFESGFIQPDGTEIENVNSLRSKNYNPCKAGTSIYMYSPNSDNNSLIAFYDKNKTYFDYFRLNPNGRTITIPNGAVYFRIALFQYNSGVYDNAVSINYPATDTTYHPYTGNTYTIAFGQTVYGGVLDVTRGKLTIVKAYTRADSLSWDKNNTSPTQWLYYSRSLLGIAKASGDCVCSHCPSVSEPPITVIGMNINANRVCYLNFLDAIGTNDLASFNAYITNNNVQLVYELATPFDIDLTPEVISAVVGTNNVFADCGQTTVKYLKAGA